MRKKKSISKIRAYRHLSGLTLKDVASTAHIAVSFLSRIETGIRHPSPAVARRIAKALNVDPSVLFSMGEGDR